MGGVRAKASRPREVEHFVRWIRLTGCDFATHLMGAGRIELRSRLRPLDDADVDDLEAEIDGAAANGRVVIATFPWMRGARDVAAFLARLDQRERWACNLIPWGAVAQDGAVQVGLEWRTKNDDASSVMGLAPLATMPVPRRAPFVSLVVWGGGNENSLWPYPLTKGRVGITDVPTQLASAEEHAEKMASTTSTTRVLLRLPDPPDDMRVLREVAFILPQADLHASLPRLFP